MLRRKLCLISEHVSGMKCYLSMWWKGDELRCRVSFRAPGGASDLRFDVANLVWQEWLSVMWRTRASRSWPPLPVGWR